MSRDKLMEGRRCPKCKQGVLVRRVGVRDYATGLPQFWCDNCGEAYTRADFSIPANRGQMPRRARPIEQYAAPPAQLPPETRPEPEFKRLNPAPGPKGLLSRFGSGRLKSAYDITNERAEKILKREDRGFRTNEPAGYLFVRAYLKVGSDEFEIVAKVIIGMYGEFDSSKPITLPPGKHVFDVIYSDPTYGDFIKHENDVIKAGKIKRHKVVFDSKHPTGGGGGGTKVDVNVDTSSVSSTLTSISETIKGIIPGRKKRSSGGGTGRTRAKPEAGKELCTNCYHIHGKSWDLTRLNDIDIPVWISNMPGISPNPEVFYCNSCRNYFLRDGHRLVPLVNEICDEPGCGRPKNFENSPTPGAHTGVVRMIYCPEHQGLHVELADQDFKDYIEYKKNLAKRANEFQRRHRIEGAKGRHGIPGVGPHGEWKGDTIFDAFSSGKKKQKFEMEARKIDKEHLIQERMLDKFGVGASDAEINRLPREEREQAKAYLEELERAGGTLDQEEEARSAKESGEYYTKARESNHWTKKVSRAFGEAEKKTGPTPANIGLSLVIIAAGVIIASIIGDTWLIVASIAFGLYIVVPNPEDNKLRHMPPMGAFGPMGSTFMQENGINTAIATLKVLSKITAIFCFGITLFNSKIPMSALALLAFCLYMSAGGLKITYNPKRSDEVMESIMRLIAVPFIAIFVFGLFGGGLFHAPAIGTLFLAFFAIIPKPSETENLARALGLGLSGATANYEMWDKLLFLIIMLLAGGMSFGLFGAGVSFDIGLFSGGSLGIIFSAIWAIALLVGLFSPSETRPAMGIIIMIISFITFGSTVGEQAMGTAFFGQWWPMLHNSATQLLEPVGKLGEMMQQTFGQSFLMLTNPVGYAQQIMSGQYAKNPNGPTGAYGLEIQNFAVDTIYLEEPFSIRFDIANKGPYTARNVNLQILSNMPDTLINDNALAGSDTTLKLAGETKYDHIKWYKYKYDSLQNHDLLKDPVIPQDVKPMFLTGTIGCTSIGKTPWGAEWVTKIPQEELRQHYVSYMINYTYDYNVDSSLQIDVISESEWYNLVRDNKLVRSQVSSLISTAPVKLSIGAMDQPIREGMPFYVGYNLTSAEGSNTMIGNAVVNMIIPSDFGVPKTCTHNIDPNNELITLPIHGSGINTEITNLIFSAVNQRAMSNFAEKMAQWRGKTKIFTVRNQDNDIIAYVLSWSLVGGDAKYSFCNWDKAPNLVNAPRRTFTLMANSTYTFNKWEKKDTMINFRDICFSRYGAANVEAPVTTVPPGDPGYCEWKYNNGQGRCQLGEGGCLNTKSLFYSDNACCNSEADCPGATANNFLFSYDGKPLTCMMGVAKGVCCPEDSEYYQCLAAYREWLRQKLAVGGQLNGNAIYSAFKNAVAS